MTEAYTRHIFLHLPRTAGAAVQRALVEAYEPDERLVIEPGGWGSGRKIDVAGSVLTDRLRLVVGSLTYGAHTELPGEWRYLTVLRNPLDRVVSLYASQVDMRRKSLSAWLDGEPLEANNGMVRALNDGSDRRFGDVPEHLLDGALVHLASDFDAVLIRGRMSLARKQLEAATGRPIPPIRRENVSPDRPDVRGLDAELRERIAELNALDLRLFQAVVDGVADPDPSRGGHRSAAPSTASQPSSRDRSMSSVEPVPTMLFMHIAKTGGTSVRKSLAAGFGPKERAFVYDPADLKGAISVEQFRALSEKQRSALRLVMGHFPYGLHRWLGRPFRYVTVLRDPVDRVVSLYYHYRHLRGLRIGGRARREQSLLLRTDMSLQDWIFGQQRLATDNGMVRNIAARPRVPFGACPDDLLDEALEHIDRDFALVLTVDQLARGLPSLAELAGRELVPVGRDNVNRRRLRLDELDPDVLDRIRELNRLDVRLYEHIRERAPSGSVASPDG